MKNFFSELFSKARKDPLVFSLVFAFFFYASFTFEFFNRPWIGEPRNLHLPIDDFIPFIKEFIIPYHTFMQMLVVVGMLLFVYNRSLYIEFVLALFISQTLAYLIFVVFQTYVPRYEMALLGDDIFSKIVKFTYLVDDSYAGLPSMHVSNSVIAAIYILKSKLKKPTRNGIAIYMIFVASTTVFVKQHVFLDVPAGVVHAFIASKLSSNIIKRKLAYLVVD